MQFHERVKSFRDRIDSGDMQGNKVAGIVLQGKEGPGGEIIENVHHHVTVRQCISE
jgi:hypothetical protein